MNYKGADRTVVRVLRDQVRRNPDQTFLYTDSGAVTRSDADRLSNGLANLLRAQGVSKGDTVLLMLPNTQLYVLAWLGVAKLGAIEVPVHVEYKGQMLIHAINASAAKVLVTDDGLLAGIHAVKGELATLETVISSPGSFGEADLGRRISLVSLGDLKRSDQSDSGEDPAYSDSIALMYTSGTTGPSKGVLVSHVHAYEYANAVRTLLGLCESDIYYAPLPLFHIAGQWAVVYASLMSGGAVVIKDRFSVSEFWGDVATSKATVSFLLGAMANFLYGQPASPSSGDNTLTRMLVAPLISDLDGFKERFRLEVTTCYASTETNVPIIADFEVSDPRQCGRARPGWQVEIVDGNDEVVSVGTAGEIVVRPPGPWLTMKKYLGQPEATAEAYRNCWLHTGDMAYMDADGNFYFVDRLKDAIRWRGENVSSFEVEREVNAHPAVLESAGVAVPSKHGEDEIMVHVVLNEGAALLPHELYEYLWERAPRFMVPRYIRIADALPKTETGKIQKAALREFGVEGGWDAVESLPRMKA